jgi:hypothetical protein
MDGLYDGADGARQRQKALISVNILYKWKRNTKILDYLAVMIKVI